MNNNKIELIRQALSASESSIKLAKQLLSELERAGGVRKDSEKPRKDSKPGVMGIFDGEQMITETGEKHPVPENYASKSILVVGDTLKLVEENGEKRFKQIEHVKRHKSMGILAKKDGKWKVVTSEGSYKVLPASVAHFNGEVGDEVVLHLPANNLSVTHGAIESIKNKIPKQETEVKVGEQTQSKEMTQKNKEDKVEQAKNTGLNREKSKKPKKNEESPKQEVTPKKEAEAKPKDDPKILVEETAQALPVTQTIDEDDLS